MKHTILLIPLCICITLIGMQKPQSPDDQFLNAIEKGNYNEVVKLFEAHPELQKQIKQYSNYANKPILQYSEKPPKNGGTFDQYMEIGRYLVSKDAKVADEARTKLKAWGQRQKAPAPVLAPPQPVYQQPAHSPTSAAKPLAVPTYTHPTPAAAPMKPAAYATRFSDIQDAVASRDLRRLEESLARLDVRTLNNIEQETLFRNAAVSNFIYVTSYEQLVSLKKIINALLAKGLKPGQASADVQKALKNTVGTRSGLVQTPLTQAIYDGNMSEAHRLIMIEKVDVNEPNTAGVTPLLLSITRKNSALAKLLLENGAQTANLFSSEQIELKKMLSSLP